MPASALLFTDPHFESMNFDIALCLIQDGVTTGAIYALLALALLLVFAVTRIIFVPQGDFISYAGLTLGTLQLGVMPGTVYLLVGGGALVAVLDGYAAWRERAPRRLLRIVLVNLALPIALALLTAWAAPRKLDAVVADRVDDGAGDPARADAVPCRLPATGRRLGAGAVHHLDGLALRAVGTRAGDLRRRGTAHQPDLRCQVPARRAADQRAEPVGARRHAAVHGRAVGLLRTIAHRQGAAGHRDEPHRRAPGRHSHRHWPASSRSGWRRPSARCRAS